MDKIRKKLVELLDELVIAPASTADYFIANGVTVQQWIPASEPPVVGERVNVSICDDSGDTRFYYSDTGWYSGIDNKWIVDDEFNTHVTHWMPLPAPMKGK